MVCSNLKMLPYKRNVSIDNPIYIHPKEPEYMNADIILGEIDMLELSDKRFNFLNNLISCTISVLSPPPKNQTVPARGKGKPNESCECFKGKRTTSYKKLVLTNRENEGKCLFFAAELGRNFADTHLEGMTDYTVEEIEQSEIIDKRDSSSLDQIIADKTATATAKDREKARIRKKFTTLYNSHEKKMQNDVQKLFHYAVQRRMQKNTEKGFEPDFANNVS